MMRRRVRALALLVGLAAVVAACGDETGAGGGNDGDDTIVVSAAASLTDAFGRIAEAFEAEHPGVDVDLNLGSSATLAQQIVEGAPVDVFAAASPATMQTVVAAGLDDDPTVFARNALAIAVPPGNPAGIRGLADFADPSLILGMCAPEVPCGQYARTALAGAGVQPAVDTEEPDVRALLTKVEAGELDAGIVYRSDVAAAGEAVDAVPIPAADNVTADYPIVTLDGAPSIADDFVAFVTGAAGREILTDTGFALP